MRLLGGCAASKADAEELVRLEVSPDTPTSSVPIRVESQHFVRLLSWRLRTKWDLPTGKSVWLLATRSILALLLSTVCVYYVWPPRPFLDDPGGFWRHRACDLPTAKADFPAYARANCSIVSTSRDVDLAVAIPLVARQQEALLASLQTWSQKKPSPLQATRFDVILFVSTTQGQLSPSIEHQIGKAATADCAAHRWLLDRFVYSSLIINLSLGPCMNDSEINEAFPSAHLAHYNPQRCDTHAVKYHTS